MRVQAVDAQGRSLIVRNWHAADNEGEFTLHGLPPGKIEIQVGSGDRLAQTSVNLSEGGEADVSLLVER